MSNKRKRQPFDDDVEVEEDDDDEEEDEPIIEVTVKGGRYNTVTLSADVDNVGSAETKRKAVKETVDMLVDSIPTKTLRRMDLETLGQEDADPLVGEDGAVTVQRREKKRGKRQSRS